MREKITPHLQSLIDQGKAGIARQFLKEFVADPTLEPQSDSRFQSFDPLSEDSHEVVKGLVHKYENRVLWKVSYLCAAHCQFCTRTRQIGTDLGNLSEEDIFGGLKYLEEHPEINEVILSGGDPFFAPQATSIIFNGLMKIKTVKSVRIGTRMPIHLPNAFGKKPIQKLLGEMEKQLSERPIFILINVEHPDELTQDVREVIRMLRAKGFLLFSQTVFLRGVNNSEEVLKDLFENLFFMGIIPYYIYRCDYVKGLETYVCSLEEEKAIMTSLRSRLSGLACPTYVVDVEGKGKIPVPLNYWEVQNPTQCRDFDFKTVNL